MNWLPFLNRDGKTKKTSKKGRGSPRRAAGNEDSRFGWNEARMFLLIFLGMAAAGTMLWAWSIGQPYRSLAGYIAIHHPQIATTGDIRFAGPVVAVDGVESHLIQRAIAVAENDPYHMGTLKAIHTTMVDSGWMEPGTVRISRDLITTPTLDGRGRMDCITIEGTFRQPFALVRRGPHDYLIDAAGTRLPVRYNAGQVTAIPVITGARGAVPEIGSLWKGRDLSDGVALIRRLRLAGRPWLATVREFDVSNADGRERNRSRIELITARGYRVAWGRAVGDEAGIDIPSDDKIRVLDAWYAEHRTLGSPQGTLRFNQPVITRGK